MPPTVSIVLPTYNRAALLPAAIGALLEQQAPAAAFEIVAVDNDSSDGTAALLAEIRDPRLRAIRESRQGLAHARNAGIAAAGGDILAFTNDHVEVAPDWVMSIMRALAAHPDVDGVGGRVLPAWQGQPPGWLTREHWAPLALQDHGDGRRVFDARRPIGLAGANVAFRRSVFQRIGLFAGHVHRVRDGIGSTEDHELLSRLYTAGGRMLYSPEMTASTRVQADRYDRGYHRKWHEGHGHFSALMRLPDVERTRVAPFGVPGHLMRAAARDAGAWVRSVAASDWEAAFRAELRLRFFKGFVRARVAVNR